MLDLKKEILLAQKKIQPHVYKTPLYYSTALSKLSSTHVYLKCENLQYTGSFKIRGALNKLLSLSPNECEQGIVTASSGNHGAAVAFGLNQLKIPGVVFVPENASSAKINNILSYEATLKYFGQDCVEAENYAMDFAKTNHMVYISPYNDPHVIAGQGTIATELTEQLNTIDVILAPVGGGGLITGIASYIKALSPQTQIIGCLPENSPVMFESIKAGKIIDMPSLPTLSDGSAGGIVKDSMTFELCEKYVDDFILVSESEIQEALIALLNTQHLLVEGSGALALASLLKERSRFHDKNVVLILTGANINLETLKQVLA